MEGREFQSLGAAALKDLPPIVESLIEGTVRSPELEDRRAREGQYNEVRSERYVRARPCRVLKVKRRILYLILELIGSQCNCGRTGVI